METYDIFKSEGGYCLCLGTWGGNPIVDQCPWYETKNEAIDAGKKHRIQDQCYHLAEGEITTLSPEFLGGHVDGTEYENYVKHIWHLAHKKKPTKKEWLEMEEYINSNLA